GRAATTAMASLHKVPHAGLQLAGGSHNVFRDNLFFKCGYGLLISTNPEEMTCDNEFTGNVIADSEQEGIRFQAYNAEMRGRMNDNRFARNVICGSGSYQVRLDLPGGDTTAFWGNTFRENDVPGDVVIRCMAVQATLDEAQRRWPGTFQANQARTVRF